MHVDICSKQFYDPAMKRLNYCGLGYYSTTQKVSELIPDLNRRVGWPDDTELTIYEEQASNVVQKITNLNDSLDKVCIRMKFAYTV